MTDKKESPTQKMRELHGDKELTMEQLDDVAGGSAWETSDDSCFLNVLLRGRPGQCDRYGEWKCSKEAYGSEERCREVQAAWASVGIKFSWNADGWKNKNSYKLIGGRNLSRDEAYAHAMKVVGKTLKKSDWYWEK